MPLTTFPSVIGILTPSSLSSPLPPPSLQHSLQYHSLITADIWLCFLVNFNSTALINCTQSRYVHKSHFSLLCFYKRDWDWVFGPFGALLNKLLCHTDNRRTFCISFHDWNSSMLVLISRYECFCVAYVLCVYAACYRYLSSSRLKNTRSYIWTSGWLGPQSTLLI